MSGRDSDSFKRNQHQSRSYEAIEGAYPVDECQDHRLANGQQFLFRRHDHIRIASRKQFAELSRILALQRLQEDLVPVLGGYRRGPSLLLGLLLLLLLLLLRRLLLRKGDWLRRLLLLLWWRGKVLLELRRRVSLTDLLRDRDIRG